MYNYFSRIPCIYIDVKETISSLLGVGSTLLVGNYNQLETTFGMVKELLFDDEGKDLESYDLLEFTLTYTVKRYKDELGFYEEEHRGHFIYLHANGDTKWTYRLVQKLWENNFPSGVLIDKDNGKVYLVRFDMDKIKLEYFSTLSSEDLELVLNEINVFAPYEMGIKNEALMGYVDGGKGLDYLYENVYIQLNCSVPIYLSKK